MNQTTAIIDYSAAAGTGSIATQTSGLLIDAYRDLHAKRLFWITLVLSLLVVIAFAFVGINERGWKLFIWEFPSVFNTQFIPRDAFYRFLFTSIAIPWWLGFLAAILALVSVGGMFPDMLSSGSIDLYLSKPLSRVRLFLTKYLFALLFVALQVLVFCTASFFVMGLRGGAWEPGIFLAVPLVTLFFSYLYCICVLLGVLTGSTLASILLTVLIWGALFMMNSADAGVLVFKVASEQRVQQLQKLIDANERVLARNAALPPAQRSNLSQFEYQRDRQKEQLTRAEETARQFRFWHRLVVSMKTPLPKTSETVDLMSRWLLDPDPFFAASQESHAQRQARRARMGRSTTRPADDLETYLELPETERRITETFNTRSVAWVIGTSVGFEAAVLALASWIFCRRDF